MVKETRVGLRSVGVVMPGVLSRLAAVSAGKREVSLEVYQSYQLTVTSLSLLEDLSRTDGIIPTSDLNS